MFLFLFFACTECKAFQVSIEFSLEHPEGGVQFVIPDGEGTMAQVSTRKPELVLHTCILNVVISCHCVVCEVYYMSNLV